MTATRTVVQEDLVRRIRQHLSALDAKYGFIARLARENGWTQDHAQKVVDEYAKFLFIAREGGQPVSPPETIDKAWPLHLVHTEEYWGDFCPNILQMMLHHSPATGTHGEQARLADWSGHTRASYIKFFGPLPSFWFDPQPFRKSSGTNGAAVGIGITALVIMGIGLVSGISGFIVIGFILLLVALFILIAGNSIAGKGSGTPGQCETSCGATSGGTSGFDSGSHHGGHTGGHGSTHSCSSHGGGHSCGGGGHSCGGGGH